MLKNKNILLFQDENLQNLITITPANTKKPKEKE